MGSEMCIRDREKSDCEKAGELMAIATRLITQGDSASTLEKVHETPVRPNNGSRLDDSAIGGAN